MNKENFFYRILITMSIGAFFLGAGCAATPDESADQTQIESEGLEIVSENERPARPTEPVGILPADRIENKIVRLSTNKGEIVFELFATDAPKTVSNFVALAESGFYDSLTFHRVVPGFVIQGGDPQGTGRGDPGYKFEDEPIQREYLAGTVAMANSGPNTNGSQFFICLEDQPGLPKAYTIFGQVISGLDVVRAIAVGDVMNQVLIEEQE